MPSRTPPETNRRKAPLARYVNYFEVTHNAFEFLIDFAQYQPESATVQVHSRMATSPTHAKLLCAVLGNALRQFEQEYGEIADLLEADDPLDLILASLPDFEQRAVRARVAAVNNPALAHPRNTNRKR
ncbi:DUF3467 domain-containing protein [Paraburkholderia xenovorans]|uniref:DUF3467 domain-containing protein n=1 Tax=Paraburkholderia xenovorans TaxID=36873 RepID=UPI0038B85D7F